MNRNTPSLVVAKKTYPPSKEFTGLKIGRIVKLVGMYPGYITLAQAGKWGVIRRFNRTGKPVVQLSMYTPGTYDNDAAFIKTCWGQQVTIPMRPMIRTSQEAIAILNASFRAEEAREKPVVTVEPLDTAAMLDSISEPNSAPQTTPDERHEGGLRVGICASCGNRFIPNYERSMGLLICDSCYWDWHSKPEKEEATSGYDGEGNVYMRFLAAVAKTGVTDPNRSRLFDDVEKIGVYMGAADWRTLYLLLQSLRITYRTWESD